MTLEYAMLFMTDEDGSVDVSFPDLPGCNTWGRDEDEAKINAAAAYHAYAEAMYDQGMPMPMPQEYELRKNKKAATDGD